MKDPAKKYEKTSYKQGENTHKPPDKGLISQKSTLNNILLENEIL